MKKSIPKVRERESEASILGNDREREFPLTPDTALAHRRKDKLDASLYPCHHCFWNQYFFGPAQLLGDFDGDHC